MNPLDSLELQAFCRKLNEEMPALTESTAKVKWSYVRGMPKNFMEDCAVPVDNRFLNDNLSIVEEIAHRDPSHPIPKWFREYQIKHFAKHGILKADGFFVRDRFFGRMFPREIYYGAGANYHNMGIASVIGNTKVLGPITIDTNNRTNSGAASTTQTANITIGSNSNRLLVAIIHLNSAVSISSVKIGATSFTSAGSVPAGYTCAIYFLINPPTGAQTVTVTLGSSAQCDIGLVSLYNCDQTTGVDTGNTGTNTGPGITSVTITPTHPDSWIIGGIGSPLAAFTSPNRTSLYEALGNGGGGMYEAAQYYSTPTIGGSNTLSWSGGGGYSGAMAIEVLAG